jgi:Ca-activated chloride channel family protein
MSLCIMRDAISLKEAAMRRRTLALLAVLFGLLITTAPVWANGIPWPRPPHPRPPRPIPRPWPIPRHPLQLKEHHVKVDITDGVAVSRIDEVYYNPNPWQFEGSFLYPLPGDAAVSRFAMSINGKLQEGELLDAEKARRIYTDIVRRMKDPGLLEYMGMKAFRLRVFPVPPRGEKRVRIEYTRILKGTAGLFSFENPLGTDRFTSHPPRQVTFDVTIRSKLPLKTIYSPSHPVHIMRKGDHEARLSFEMTNRTPKKDFRLYYSVSEKAFGMSLLSFKAPGEDGYFMAILAPKQRVDAVEIVKKDVVFILDRSGSMAGEKIEQARKALRFCVNSLSAGDRFTIVPFSTEAETWKESLVAAIPENVRSARTYIDSIRAMGGTNIDGALQRAMAMKPPDSDRPFMVVFLTDGEPTIGETSTPAILNNVRKYNVSGTRLFAFGIGTKLNTHLLDKLAEQNGGDREYVAPNEDLEIKVSNFYSKIAHPVLAGLVLDFPGLGAYDVYPKRLPDLFRGSQLIVMGRYKNPGMKAVKLTGELNGKSRSYVYESTFAGRDTGTAFLPRTWASRKIGYLLDHIRLHGENRELKQEIVRLAKKYGIITPYTSYLVLEDVKRHARRPSSRIFRGFAEAPEATRRADEGRARMRLKGGAGGVDASKELKKMRKAGKPSAPSREFARDARGREMIRTAGEKTFYRSGEVWMDSAYDGKAQTVKVAYLSDAYFDLLARHRSAVKYFSVGSRVIVVLADGIYEVTREKEPAGDSSEKGSKEDREGEKEGEGKARREPL